MPTNQQPMATTYLAIYDGQHDKRPDWSPQVTCLLTDFLGDNDYTMASAASFCAELAEDGYAVVGGGAGPAFTVFVDAAYDPNHEGVEPSDTITLSRHERHTIAAALDCFEAFYDEESCPAAVVELATASGEFEAMSTEDLNLLSQRILPHR